MKYKIKNSVKNNEIVPTGNFIRVPENIDFKMNSTPFKVLVWLLKHKHGFEMNEYFIKQGLGMDYRTFRKYLMILEEYGYLTINSTDTISTCAISYTDKGDLVCVLTNKSKKQEERKPEEKPEKIKPETVSRPSVPLGRDTAKNVDFGKLLKEFENETFN